MKEIIREFKKFYYFYPQLVAVVGVEYKGKVNFLSVAWNTALSFTPPMYGISLTKKRYSFDLIKNAGEFTCNFLPFEKSDIVHKCGRVSGTDVDKIKKIPLELQPSETIASPGLKEAYTMLECKLVDIVVTGDHNLFVGEILTAQVDGEYFNEDGTLRTEKIKPALYLGAETYITTDSNSIITKDRNIVL